MNQMTKYPIFQRHNLHLSNLCVHNHKDKRKSALASRYTIDACSVCQLEWT